MKLFKNFGAGICFALAIVCGLIVLGQRPLASAASSTPQLLGWNGGHQLKYVALGDSVAAGLGYGVGIVGDEDYTCGRSAEAYAYRVADQLNERLGNVGLSVAPQLVACQGAVTRNLLEAQLIGGLNVRPQLDRAFESGRPALLTLTSGANDVQWASFIGACFGPTNCNTPENDAVLQAYIGTMTVDMRAAMQSIKARSFFLPPLVIATGYYTPVSLQCANSNFTANEVAWVQQATAKLNNAISNATQGSYWFARFAPVNFEGHDICAADAWIQRPGEQAPFHPTPRGQEEIANAILRSIGF